jgi:TetR/AcrR family tetracycline transcriptional repressor
VRRSVSRARILRTALALVDREGLDALTMRRVAAQLQVGAMSLYYYVPNKEAILDGVFDLVIAKADLPTGEVSAAEWIRGAAQGFRRLALQHPRTFPLLASRPIPLVDIAAAEPMEAGMAAFVRLGMEAADAYAALQAVLMSLLSLGLLESQAMLDPLPAAASQLEALPEAQFPLLRAVPDLDLDRDAVWSCLVETLVRGLTDSRRLDATEIEPNRTQVAST